MQIAPKFFHSDINSSNKVTHFWKEEELTELILLMLKCVFIQEGLRSFSTSQESAYYILDYPAISQALQ